MRERIEQLQVGESIELPAKDWHINHEAKEAYRLAKEHAAGTSKQFEIQNGERYATKLVRIR